MLNDRQADFCREYIIDWNATKAAERAGYAKKSARSMASTLLTKQNIQNEIKRLTDELLGVQKDQIRYRVVSEIKKLGLEEDEIAHRDKLKALELLGKYAGIFEEDHKRAMEITLLTPEERRARIEELNAKRS